MKDQIVFKLEKEPNGFSQVFAPDCKIDIKNKEGLLYLNYEKRAQRVVGSYKNLRQEGEVILADVELRGDLTPVEHRITYSIEGDVVKKNDNNEAISIVIQGVGALMDSES